MLRIDLSTIDDELMSDDCASKLCSASMMVTITQQEAMRQIACKPAVYGLWVICVEGVVLRMPPGR
jgi:hypothetical protein